MYISTARALATYSEVRTGTVYCARLLPSSMAATTNSSKHSGSSLKAVNQKIAKKKQVYKPILANPFTNESHLWSSYWPSDPDLLLHHILQQSILSKYKLLKSSNVPVEQWPFQLLTDYNEIIQFLSQDDKDTKSNSKNDKAILFVCNRDTNDIPLVLLQPVPLLVCLTRRADVTMVSLPTGAYSMIKEAVGSSTTTSSLQPLLLLLPPVEQSNSGNSGNWERLVKQITDLLPVGSSNGNDNDKRHIPFPWIEKLKFQRAKLKLVSMEKGVKGDVKKRR